MAGQVAFHDVTPAVERLSDSFGSRRLNLYLVGLFAVVALTLAAIGLFGAMAWFHSAVARSGCGWRSAHQAEPPDYRSRRRAGGGRHDARGGRRRLADAIDGRPSLLPVAHRASDLFSGPDRIVYVSILACHVLARRVMRVDPVIASARTNARSAFDSGRRRVVSVVID